VKFINLSDGKQSPKLTFATRYIVERVIVFAVQFCGCFEFDLQVRWNENDKFN
jgi:hypothetical protein